MLTLEQIAMIRDQLTPHLTALNERLQREPEFPRDAHITEYLASGMQGDSFHLANGDVLKLVLLKTRHDEPTDFTTEIHGIYHLDKLFSQPRFLVASREVLSPAYRASDVFQAPLELAGNVYKGWMIISHMPGNKYKTNGLDPADQDVAGKLDVIAAVMAKIHTLPNQVAPASQGPMGRTGDQARRLFWALARRDISPWSLDVVWNLQQEKKTGYGRKTANDLRFLHGDLTFDNVLWSDHAVSVIDMGAVRAGYPEQEILPYLYWPSAMEYLANRYEEHSDTRLDHRLLLAAATSSSLSHYMLAAATGNKHEAGRCFRALRSLTARMYEITGDSAYDRLARRLMRAQPPIQSPR